MLDAPSFPPLLTGREAPPGADPVALAAAAAADGVDPGLLVWSPDEAWLAAALVLAPECPLEEAMAMVFAVSIGFSDALGALAPPEVGVHFEWPGALRVNGGRCGEVRAVASNPNPEAEPDWLVVGLDVPLHPEGLLEVEAGHTPDLTCLHMEGCGDLTARGLLESWSRHTLVWINRWLDDGMAPLHAEWRSKAHGLGGETVGLDENGGLIRRVGARLEITPLTSMLGRPE